MACVRHAALAFNCEYARVCIYENSNPKRTGPNARDTIDISKRSGNSLVTLTLCQTITSLFAVARRTQLSSIGTATKFLMASSQNLGLEVIGLLI